TSHNLSNGGLITASVTLPCAPCAPGLHRDMTSFSITYEPLAGSSITLSWDGTVTQTGQTVDPYITLDSSQSVYDWHLALWPSFSPFQLLITMNTTNPAYDPLYSTWSLSSTEDGVYNGGNCGAGCTLDWPEYLINDPGAWTSYVQVSQVPGP